MDWWKRKKSRAAVKKQRLVLERVRGEILIEDLIECCDGKSNPIKIFSAEQILQATNVSDCSSIYGLSDHMTMRWYSGMLDDHRMILVNRLRHVHPNYPWSFCEGALDITISSMVSGHKNFMKLVGCCLEFAYPVMVYYGVEKQYSPIDLNLVLSWRRRMKVAEDIAIALAYLHTAFPRPFVYRNMHLRNILLDEDGVGKLSNFSHCVSIPQGETFVKLGFRFVGGDYDYLDDNYLINGVV